MTAGFPLGEMLRDGTCPAPALRQCRRAPAAQKAGPCLPALMKRCRAARFQPGTAPLLGARLCPVTATPELLTSDVRDISGVPLSAEVDIGGLEYMRIMRRIGLGDGEAATPVSAFNSSI